MLLRKCLEHGYTIKEVCSVCGKETKSAHYKFIKMKNAVFKKGFSEKVHS